MQCGGGGTVGYTCVNIEIFENSAFSNSTLMEFKNISVLQNRRKLILSDINNVVHTAICAIYYCIGKTP